MALVDNINKVIYWDEVNWQWLPFIVSRGKEIKVFLPRRGGKTYVSVGSEEEVVSCLSNEGYSLQPLSILGIIEITKGCYLYSGKVYKNEKKVIISLPNFLAKVSGSHSTYVHRHFEGKGVLSESQLEKLVNNLTPERGVLDHLGNKFGSVEEMAEHWGIPLKVYNNRRYRRWSLERTLTTPVRENKECVEFKGNVFPSIQSMSKKYEVPYVSILYHISKGMTPVEALEYLLSKEKAKRKVIDHLGNSFSSYNKMANFYGITLGTLSSRLKCGWSLEEALTGKRQER